VFSLGLVLFGHTPQQLGKGVFHVTAKARQTREAHAERKAGKAGRPRGPNQRPNIPLANGDTLVPKTKAADELGVSPRTLTRMKPSTVMFGGISYVAMGKLRAQIAEGLSSKKRRGRR
jgi:hypothetical protein